LNFKPDNIKISLLYFLWIGSTAAWLPMFTLYFERIGFNGFQIGILASIIPVTMMIGQPAVSVLADKYGRLKILILVLLLTAFTINGLLIKGGFAYFFIIVSLFALCYSPINPLVDSTVLDFVESTPSSSYSRIRLWGSVGWMSCTYLVGRFTSNHELYWTFLIGSGLLVLTTIVSTTIKLPGTSSKDQSITFRDAKSVISDPKILIFLLILLLYGIGTIPINTFYGIYLNKIGASTKIIGLSFAIQAFSELPFLFIASHLVRRFGALPLTVIALSVSGVRILAYTQINNPYIAICIDTSNGICYSLFLVSAVEYINKMVPAKLRATGQSLFWVSYYGAGVMCGNLFTGFLYGNRGIGFAFAIDGLILLATAVIAIFMNRHYRNAEKTKSRNAWPKLF
jgi:PPP family 3-phenylpropionic acid transporter